jgi:uncharacterized protein (TIGR02453 family)
MPTFFTEETFAFLRELKKNNKREWFQQNKDRFESHVRKPMLDFIAAFAPQLKRIGRHFVADPSPTGGSMFRIYRDIRFSEDKSPYKTHAAAHFSHSRSGNEIHAPGFYLHIEPGSSFCAAGVWHPDSPTLVRIRRSIIENTSAWKRLRIRIQLGGDKLSNPPKGVPKDHPLIEDLKHKDFVASVAFTDTEVCSTRFLDRHVSACRKMSPLVKFLTKAMRLPY